jgi:hypothetical protein
MNYQNPISSCSKAPRGLSVLSQVTGIFTGITISPSPSSRQRPDRYAFRAGLNLPDKEFRYLRTVIVTAAVHRGFGSVLCLRLHFPLTFRHRAGVSLYTSSFDFAETCVFVKQSPGPDHCGSLTLILYILTLPEHPFSLSYGVILPSSLTRVLSRALGFSPHLPVSVCGTGTRFLARGFSWQFGINDFATLFHSPSHFRLYVRRFCLPDTLRAWTHSSNRALHLSSCVTPSLVTEAWWHWIFNQLSIPYAFRPRVRSRLTLGGRAFPRKPWVYGEQDSHLLSRLLMPAFSLLSSPLLLSV